MYGPKNLYLFRVNKNISEFKKWFETKFTLFFKFNYNVLFVIVLTFHCFGNLIKRECYEKCCSTGGCLTTKWYGFWKKESLVEWNYLYFALELVTNLNLNRLLFKIYIDFCSTKFLQIPNYAPEFILFLDIAFFFKKIERTIELTKVGSVKSGKWFVVNDTIIQAIQRTAIKMTIRYGRRTKTL